MVIPKYRSDPSNTPPPNGSIEPSDTEKYPSSKVTVCFSLQIGSFASAASYTANVTGNAPSMGLSSASTSRPWFVIVCGTSATALAASADTPPASVRAEIHRRMVRVFMVCSPLSAGRTGSAGVPAFAQEIAAPPEMQEESFGPSPPRVA
jgi:hypothetical protein